MHAVSAFQNSFKNDMTNLGPYGIYRHIHAVSVFQNMI